MQMEGVRIHDQSYFISISRTKQGTVPVSYTHLTLPTNREV